MQQEDLSCLLLPLPLILGTTNVKTKPKVNIKGKTIEINQKQFQTEKIFSVFNAGTKARHFV